MISVCNQASLTAASVHTYQNRLATGEKVDSCGGTDCCFFQEGIARENQVESEFTEDRLHDRW